MSRWHRIALYFGLGKETEDDRQVRAALPEPSPAVLVFSSVIAAVVAGAIFGVLDWSVWKGVIFAVLMAMVLLGQILWRRRRQKDWGSQQ
jgi:hypothetical protein